MKTLFKPLLIFFTVLMIGGAASSPEESEYYAKLDAFRYLPKGSYDYRLYLPDTTIFVEAQLKTDVEVLNQITNQYGLSLFSVHPKEKGCVFYLVKK